MNFNRSSTGNRKKAVIWNGLNFESGQALKAHLMLKSSGSVSIAITNGTRLKGAYVRFALIDNKQ